MKRAGMLTLVFLNVSAVLNLKNMAALAVFGWSSVVWYVIFALMFLVPIGYMASELGSKCKGSGGLHSWVMEAYPKKGAKYTIIFAWIENIAGIASTIAFMVVVVSYGVMNPELRHNLPFMAVVSLLMLWGMTLLSIKKSRSSAKISAVACFVGAMIPLALLAILTVIWLLSGNTSNLGDISVGSFVPVINIQTITFAGSLIMVFAGMEMTGYYAHSINNYSSIVRRALFIGAMLIALISAISSLSIAAVVPNDFLTGVDGAVDGVVRAFDIIFDSFGIGWAITPIGLMLSIGVMALVYSWMSGVTRGAHNAAMHGSLPPFIRKSNSDGAPVGALLFHAILGSFFLILYLALIHFHVNGYWVLVTICSIGIGLKNLMLIVTYLKLRRTRPEFRTGTSFLDRHGKTYSYITIGIVIVAMAFMVNPPIDYGFMGDVIYVGIIMFFTALMYFFIPTYVFNKKDETWEATEEEWEEYRRHNEVQ